jgi:hypothetical protein
MHGKGKIRRRIIGYVLDNHINFDIDEMINIKMISTSEIKISVVVEEKYLELAVRALHAGFELDQELPEVAS